MRPLFAGAGQSMNYTYTLFWGATHDEIYTKDYPKPALQNHERAHPRKKNQSRSI